MKFLKISSDRYENLKGHFDGLRVFWRKKLFYLSAPVSGIDKLIMTSPLYMISFGLAGKAVLTRYSKL